MEKISITSEMIESLYGMLTSSSIEDKNVAMGILNNRNLQDKTSEKNVEVLTDKVLTELWGESYTKVKLLKSATLLEGLNNQLKIIARMQSMNEPFK